MVPDIVLVEGLVGIKKKISLKFVPANGIRKKSKKMVIVFADCLLNLNKKLKIVFKDIKIAITGGKGGSNHS